MCFKNLKFTKNMHCCLCETVCLNSKNGLHEAKLTEN